MQTKFQHDWNMLRRNREEWLLFVYILLIYLLSWLCPVCICLFLSHSKFVAWLCWYETRTYVCPAAENFFLLLFYLHLNSSKYLHILFFFAFRICVLVWWLPYLQFKVRWDKTECENIVKWPWPRDFWWSSYDFEICIFISWKKVKA